MRISSATSLCRKPRALCVTLPCMRKVVWQKQACVPWNVSYHSERTKIHNTLSCPLNIRALLSLNSLHQHTQNGDFSDVSFYSDYFPHNPQIRSKAPCRCEGSCWHIYLALGYPAHPAIGWKLDIPLDEMKSSIFGCAFLLDHGGYLWFIILHALRHCRDSEWKPFSGSNGLRMAGKIRKGMLFFCPVLHENHCSSIPFTLLNTTSPGRLMIWQSEHPESRYTRQLQMTVLLKLVKMACIRSGKYLWRGLLELAILVPR